jgi:hypothetical protein
MRSKDIITRRLYAHHLLAPKFPDPAAAVAHFGAVQAQDFLASLWAVGQRVDGATEASVEQAIAGRAIIRTWPLRGTIHFVTAADARWLLNLTAERTWKDATRRLRELELDDSVFRQSRQVIAAALQAAGIMTREALMETLEQAGIAVEGQRGYHILWYHAHEGLIAIGPRVGKQQAFVLLDEWLPPGKAFDRDEALAELARRYFTGHGPATLVDFTWWSGLAPAEARAGLEAVKQELKGEMIDGQEYWFASKTPRIDESGSIAHLLPVYDEYAVGYKDRSAFLNAEYAARPDAGNGIFRPPILVGGQMVGTWTRKLKKQTVVIKPNLFRPLTAGEQKALSATAERYGMFLGLGAELDAVG